jgi:hypothetical protein
MAVLFWLEKLSEECYFGKLFFTSGIFASSVFNSGILAILSLIFIGFEKMHEEKNMAFQYHAYLILT